MPFLHTCTDHPTWKGDTADEALGHLRADHPTARLDNGPIVVRFVRQAAAQGNPERYRFHCRRCGAPVDTIIKPDPASAYCEECKS